MRPDDPVRAFVGLGGNQGDVETTLVEALWAVDALPQTTIQRQSAFYRTPAWGKTDQPAFLNAVVELRTRMPAKVLLESLLAIEEAGLEQIHLEETAYGMDQSLAEGALLATGGALIGPGPCVAGGFDQIVFQIPVGEVEQVAVQIDDLHVGPYFHLLVYQHLVVTGERLGIEAQHPIRIPAAVVYPFAAIVGKPVEGKCAFLWAFFFERENGCAQFRT